MAARGTLLCCVGLCVVASVLALDNGLGLTPQMGWNSWNYFACRVNETVIRQAAESIVSNGMKDAGYTFVNIDDCWQGSQRTAEGRLTWDNTTFPSGIPALAEYIHSLGLKFGIYTARCRFSCQLRPASYGHYVVDAQTFADWNVDYLKFDNCAGCPYDADPVTEFAMMSAALNATGKPIFYSNELFTAWTSSGAQPQQMCNSARVGHDISPNWDSMISLVDIDTPLAPWAQPGYWNDADMLEVGNGMSENEDRTHFAFWCILAAPLLAGNNLPAMTPTTLQILTAKGPLSINQDPLGFQGTVCMDNFTKGVQVWTKPLASGSTAIMVVNRGIFTTNNALVNFTQCISLGDNVENMQITDAWTGDVVGTFSNDYTVPSLTSHEHVLYIVKPQNAGASTTTACAASNTENVPVRLYCPTGMTIASIEFASFGTPKGTCRNYQIDNACNAPGVLSAVQQMCVGNSSCAVWSGDAAWGDPCPTIGKHFATQYTCSQ